MAEAIGLAASITSVIQLTDQVADLSWGYIVSVKEATNSIHGLRDELSNLSKVLGAIPDYAEDSKQAATLEMLNGKDGLLQKCAEDLRKLQVKLEPKSGVKQMIENLKWPLEETETSRYISQIERYKSLFSLALDADHIALSEAIHKGVQEIEGSLQSTNNTVQAVFVSQSTRQQQDDFLSNEEERRKALDWLYSGDPNTRHNVDLTAIEGHQDDVNLLLHKGFSFTKSPNSLPAAFGENPALQALDIPLGVYTEVDIYGSQKQPDPSSITEPNISPPAIQSPEHLQTVLEIPLQRLEVEEEEGGEEGNPRVTFMSILWEHRREIMIVIQQIALWVLVIDPLLRDLLRKLIHAIVELF